MGHVIEISQHSLRSHPLCLLVLLNLSVSDKDTIIRQSENVHVCQNFGLSLVLDVSRELNVTLALTKLS